jgi:crossover junction endodeoxyribonuclease RuvC
MGSRSSRTLWAQKLSGMSAAGLAKPMKGKQVETGQQVRLQGPFRGTVLGIDPSLRGTGLAVVRFHERMEAELLFSQTLRIPRDQTMAECLGTIARTVLCVVETHTIDEVALEETIYVQNVKTAQKLGAARGAAIAAIALKGFAVAEYPPLRVKQAVVGFGRASKEQVARQIRSLLKLTEIPNWDEADAAAVAYCHALTRGQTLKAM